MKKLLYLSIFSILTACSTLPKYCNTNGAYYLGSLDAKNWNSSKHNLSTAPRCIGDYNEAMFIRDYNEAFMGALQHQCSIEKINELGALDAASKEHSAINSSNIELCKEVGGNVKKLVSTYQTSFQKNLCSLDNANTRGTNYAKEMIAADSGFAEMCPSNIRSKLKRRFDKSYNHQIAISCGPVELTKRAINDVREERKLQDSVEVISSCPQDLQTNAVLVYQTAFAREEDRLHAANESRKQDAFREEQLDLIRKQNEILEEKKKKEQQTDGYFKPMEAIPSY